MKQITRAELRGISIADLVVLHLNRAGDINIVAEQIKMGKVTLQEDDTLLISLSPDPKTGWNHGPIDVTIPRVKVDEIYDETVIEWADCQGKTLAEVLTAAHMPPPPPSSVVVSEYLMLDPGPELKIKYALNYTNAFFTGTVVVRIANAPNNLDTLRFLNLLFTGE